MPQTLLALFAVVAASVLAFQNSRTRIDDMTRTHRSDVEVQARGAALAVVERLRGYDFDGGEGASPGATGTDAYSPRKDFGTAVPTAGVLVDALFADPALDDLDDFDGIEGAVARQTLFDPASGEERALDLAVSVEVVYLQPSAGGDWETAPPGVRTAQKRAVVTVRHATLPLPIRLAQTYVPS